MAAVDPCRVNVKAVFLDRNTAAAIAEQCKPRISSTPAADSSFAIGENQPLGCATTPHPSRTLMPGPLLTLNVHDTLRAAQRSGAPAVECSLDLERSRSTIALNEGHWTWQGRDYPYFEACKDRTIYFWTGDAFEPVQRFSHSLIKLVPTEWGAPTFEIDGIKMLPTAQVSPYADAERKVGLIEPRGKTILDCCGGLGYFAARCLQGQAKQVQSFEKNPDVIWLRSLNPWSPQTGERLTLNNGDIALAIANFSDATFDAVLHDPPRFGIAGELYSQVFYDHLARVLKRKGRLFHYTGTPNKLTSGRDVPQEVSKRLERAGFSVKPNGDGLLAVKR
jgi:predicted methyltransferase